jgi:nucleoside-diphosphate-sugar epimerase
MEFENLNILLTGASGFIGHRLLEFLENSQFDVTSAVRRQLSKNSAKHFFIESLDGKTDWNASLADKEVVIHVAGLAHVKNKNIDPTGARNLFWEVNAEGSINLARQAAAAGIKRFIFISSIGVNGSSTEKPFNQADIVNPCDAYAESKYEAEKRLWELQDQTGMEVVIIRPPLVYGTNAPGNFGSLVSWVQKGLPLPLGSIHNKRSFVALDNLVDLIITCIDHPGAANETFLVSDGEDLSTTQLLQGVAAAMGKPSRLIPVPAGLLQFGATLLGKKAMAQRLLGSLQVDISHTQKRLNWTPPLTVKQGLQRCFPHQQD